MKTDSYLFTSAGGREDNQDAVGSTRSKAGELFVLADGWNLIIGSLVKTFY